MTTLTQDWSTEQTVGTAGRSRTVTAISWTLQALIAAMFLFAGSSKLAGAPPMVQAFGLLGLGQWFRYFTGSIEVVSAVLLFIPGLALYGALAAAVTMTGAVIAHVAVLGGSPVAAAVLLAAAVSVIFIRRAGR
jgi:putative oxidoreductase